MADPRGAFIVIEGLDRSGKTTQVKRLDEQLTRSGNKVKLLRFPGEQPFISLFPLSPPWTELEFVYSVLMVIMPRSDNSNRSDDR